MCGQNHAFSALYINSSAINLVFSDLRDVRRHMSHLPLEDTGFHAEGVLGWPLAVAHSPTGQQAEGRKRLRRVKLSSIQIDSAEVGTLARQESKSLPHP
jgi:hypothetical protein